METNNGYPDYTRLRIERARQRGAESTNSAWYVGFSNNLYCEVYMVRSTRGEWMYYQEVYTHPRKGGYNYSLGREPERWIKCTCDAWTEHGVPCQHAAKVQLHLEQRLSKELANGETSDEDNDDYIPF